MRLDKTTKIILAAQIILVGVAGMFFPIYAIYVEKIGGDLLAASGARALFAILGGLLIFLFAKLEDRLKKKIGYFIVGGFLLAALGYLGYIFVQNPLHLFIVQIILGTAIALMTPALDAIYDKHLDGKHLIVGWGLLEGLWLITDGVSAIIGGFIATYLGFPMLFLTMAAISFLTGIYIMFSLKNSP